MGPDFLWECRGMMGADPVAPLEAHDEERKPFFQVYAGQEPLLK